jgi:hypothetical protein
MDDFEKRLRQQSLRQMPGEWREDILTAARNSTPDLRTHSEEQAGWSWLLARFPVAWGALAMLWAALIAVNLILSGPANRATTQPAFAGRMDPLAVLNLQQAELSLLSGKSGDETEPPPVSPLRPRSERQRDDRHGAYLSSRRLIC